MADIIKHPALRSVIAGPPGIGKATVVLKVLHDKRIQQRYGRRVFFIRSNKVNSAFDIILQIASCLGIAHGHDLESRIFVELWRGPTILALVNIEGAAKNDQVKFNNFLSNLGKYQQSL